MELSQFLQEIQKYNIKYTDKKEDLLNAQKNVTAYEREILAIIEPKNTREIQQIIQLANKYYIPLYPISTGKNIGLGSKLPINQEAVLVNLKNMNKIIEIDEVFGIAVIEPGVTQKQLAEYLKEKNSLFFIDVTGAPADTSIIGNILDKGVAYNTLRFDNVIYFQVILGTGEILNTGFSHYENTTLKNIAKHHPGPDFTRLFIQSNFGIITKAAIQLTPKTDKHIAFTISLEENNLGKIIDKIRYLKQQNILDCVVHIGNKTRSKISLAPMVYRYLKSIGQKTNRKEAENLLETFLSGSWSLVGSIKGPDHFVKAKKRIIKKLLANYGKISFITENKVKLAKWLSKILGFKKLNIYLNSISPLIGLTFGKPTNEALHSIYWRHTEENTNWLNPDLADIGFIYIVPLVPLESKSVYKLIKIIKNIEQKYKFPIAVTLNSLDAYTLEAVISFDFNKQTEKSTAHKTARELSSLLLNNGLILYRIDIENMHLIINSNDIYWKKIKDLKQIFDPNNIIAPKRFNII